MTGASSGIGNATAKALQNAGFRVFGTGRRAAAKRSDGVTMLSCDVTDDGSVAKLVDEVLAKAGRIDLLVNNAGMGLLGGAEESSTAQAQALFDVNVFGVLRMTNAVLPTVRRQGKLLPLKIRSLELCERASQRRASSVRPKGNARPSPQVAPGRHAAVLPLCSHVDQGRHETVTQSVPETI